jgi:hypothetical protein
MPLIIKTIIAFALSAIGLGVYHVPQPRPDMATTAPTSAPYEALGGFGQYIADTYRYVPPTTTTLALCLCINMGIAHGYQNWHCRQAGKLGS